jgi:PncC family amidohydrolase
VNMDEINGRVVTLFKKKQYTLSVCESCTGGMLGSIITRIPGVSRFFKGGVIAYSNEVKKRVVGVNARTLKKFGAVSPEVAVQMARCIRKRFTTHIGVAITGIAGPSGGTRLKPVGLVYIAVVTHQDTTVEQHVLDGDRHQIRKRACREALLSLLHVLQDL